MERTIKFKFSVKYVNKNQLDGLFEKIEKCLNIQFDNDFEPYSKNSMEVYKIKDVSNYSSVKIEKIIASFFNFSFDNIVDVPLYKFLVLKDNGKLTVMAIIHSSIFDYSSINLFCNVFNNSSDNLINNNIIAHYDNVNNYLNSSDFRNDSQFWKEKQLNNGDCVKYYNIQSNNYKSINVSLNPKMLFNFSKDYKTSNFNILLAIFSLYLSRVNRTKGCILKTHVPNNNGGLGPFDRDTLLAIDYLKDKSFTDYLNAINHIYDEAAEHTKVDISYYLEEDMTYYSIHDFTGFRDVNVLNGENSALSLNIYEDRLEMFYNTDLFSDIYIEHMLNNIKSLIEKLYRSPDQLCGDIDILCDDEKSLISQYCRGERFEFDKDKTLALSFRENAKINPDKLAIDDGLNKKTYAELEASSNSIAYDLSNNYDIGFACAVGVMLPRNYHFPEVVLALNKIGAVTIPIDAEYPLKRIEQMMEIGRAEHIITTKDIAQDLDLNASKLCIEDLKQNIDVEVEIKGNADDLFGIIFTSGTAGLPKGVLVPNKQLCGLGIGFSHFIVTDDDCDTIGCYASFSFVAMYLMFWALYFGNSCRIFDENERKDFLLFIKSLEECPLHAAILPAVLVPYLMENDKINIDYLLSAGSSISEITSQNSKINLCNAYGSTEVISAANVCDLANGDFSIGKPLYNTWIYILDDCNNQMPIGVPGEICVATDNLSLGYINNPELTDKAFVDNPYCDCEDNKKMYRTGDLGYYNFEGKLEIIGREDDQLSVRGYRIESGEILKIMNSFKSISEICLDVDNENLTAFYTTNDDLDIDKVKDAIKEELPAYMLPSQFVELDSIPLNVNGKIDKSALRGINHQNYSIEIEDEILRFVVDSFDNVLKTENILIDDDFVSLGGNSLSAINLQLLLKEKYNVSISSHEIIELSTPNNISDYIKSNLKDKAGIDEVEYTFDEKCRLSESQLNVYLDEITHDMGTKYNNPLMIEFSGNYSSDQIRRALNNLFDVHPVLRSRILVDEGELLSCVFDAEPEIQEGSLIDLQSFVMPFDLKKCLSRFLIMVDGDSTSLCMDIHHVIFDGSSLNILLNDLYSILNCENVDFVDEGILRQISLEEKLPSDYMDDAQEFMYNMLADLDDVHELIPSVDSDGEFKYIETFDIDENELNGFLQNHSITRNQFFSSVFGYTLSRFTGSSKALFHILEDGRGHLDHSQSVGMFVKTLPIILDCKNQTVDSFLKYSGGLINNVMKYDLYPFRFLANEFDLKFDVSFQYAHNLFSTLLDNDDCGYSVNELKHDPEGDLTFFIFDVDDDKLGIRILYSDKFSKNFIESFTKTYMLILHEMLNVCELEDVNYIDDDDLRILDSFNQTEHDLKYDCVLEAFNSQLAENPGNVLTLSDGASYTYSQIAFIVNSLNSLFKQNNVSSNDTVTVFVDRSHWTLIAALSCLSMGITYVPIDENHPDKRIEFMIMQSDSKTIIVTDKFKKRVKKIDAESNLDLNIINISPLADEIKTSNHVDYVDSSVNDVACILYTSGTTGTPKAVQMTTLGILNLIEYYVASTKFGSGDVQGIFASVGFDVSLEQFASVFTGGSVTYVPNDIRLNINKLNDYFINHGVTHTLITTQIAKLFVKNVSETSLKYLQTAGEKLGSITPPDDYILSDVYGPTEANYITSIDVQNKIDDSSVGVLNWNTKAYILDHEKRKVPFGAVGEIYLSGYQTTKGYFKNPSENEKALFENPFDGEIKGYSKMYKTGDLGRYLPDGSIAIIGRVDSQVKIRGNRVELSEIELTIRSIDDIDDVTVQIIKKGSNNELVAYVVASDFKGDIVRHVKDYVGQRKPDYMVPSFVVPIKEIPFNVNGKVDKRALPEVNVNTLSSEYVAPRNKLEQDIVEAFEEVFNCENVGIYDDFIQLGGDSLSAIKLLTILDDYNLSAGDILNLKVPYAIAEKITEDNMEFDLDMYSLDSGCPLNEAQLNVYLDIVVNEKTDAYLLPIFMEFSKNHNLNEIVDALNEMFEVHPILKMCVNDEFEVPRLVMHSEPQIVVESDVDSDFISQFLTQSFDLHDRLCKFLVIEKDDSIDLYAAFHHIICDAISCAAFKSDLLAILDGQSLEVDDSFLKVSAFAQQIQESEIFTKATDFFGNMLVECDEVGVLLDSIGADGSGTAQIDLDLDESMFRNQSDINENVLFTSVFAYTLSRFTGSDNVLFNIVDNGRDRFNNFNGIGMYVNTLPLLVDCSDRDIPLFIDDMSSLVYSALSYNFYPFRFLANEYDIDANILFQFVPEWIDNDDNNVREVYEKLGILRNMDNLNAELTFEVLKKGNEYSLNVIYSDKYSCEFINHFIQSYKLILHGMINECRLSDINYLTNNDIQLLDSYNQTEASFEYDDILDAFNHNLEECENNVLVGYEDKTYSHGQATFIANEISLRLHNSGINRQDFVALFVPRSEWFLLAPLGVLSSGCIYVPIDTNYPDERIILMLEDSKSKAVIVSDQTEQRLLKIILDNNLDIDVLNVSDITDGDVASSNHLNTASVQENDVACVLYTSGTTGTPKGVLVTRKAVNNFVSWYVEETNFTCEDNYGMYCSYVFDMHTHALYSPVITGGSLYIVPEDIRLDLKTLNDYFVEHNCTHTYITSQVGKLFAESGMKTSIKLICFGGMKLGELNAPDSVGPFESYGPSENLAISTSIFANKRTHHTSIGRFISNVKGYVLDNEHRRVPLGAVGELYLSGHQLTIGYLNRSEENSKAFFENPFDDEKGYERIYRTGDIVRFLPDGTLGIIGRQDSQVKIRGNRVELTEVESVIRNCDIVDDVTVQTVDNKGNNELVAYVEVSNGLKGEELSDVICDYVYNRKPDYMVPSYVIALNKIPLNVNGKVDKRALPEVNLVSLRAEYMAPRNNVEKDIVNAFEKVFNQDKISIYDDFIRLGGDSLTAIKLLSAIEDYNVSVADILSLHTPYAIAKNINKSEMQLDLDIYSLDSGCPLNESQLNVYLDILANEKVDAYLIHLAYDISKKYNADEIINALNEMFKAHPILEMCINDEFEVPYLVKGSKPSITVESDISEDYLNDFLSKGFDLKDSLSKFMIVENEDGFKLYAVFHHIIFDALSDAVFKNDFIRILDGESIDLDDSFLNVSAFTQNIKDTEEYVEANDFYESMLVESDEVGALLDNVLPDGPGVVLRKLDMNYDLFKSFLSENNISENAIFTSAFAYCLSRFTGSDKVLFNIIENGRDRFNNFDSIGMYVNTLPMLVDCKNQEIPSFLDYVSNMVYGVMRYNYYPFRLLANKYGIDSNILFQFIPDWIKDNDGNVIEDETEDILTNMDDLISDLTVEVIQRNDEYNLHIIYSDKFSSDFINRFLDSYNLILNGIICASKMEDINFITDNDLKVLDSYNETSHDLEYEDVLDAFRDNLSKYPNNPLVLGDGFSYSYSQCAYLIDNIGQLLEDKGIGLKDNVGILVDRNQYVLLSNLAALSIGATYVPIDENHPDARIKFMIESTGSKAIIVTDSFRERADIILSEMEDDIEIINISNILDDDIGNSNSINSVESRENDVACILFTSGTTGTPKAVPISRISIINMVSYYVHNTQFGSDDVYGVFASIGFDVSLQYYAALLCGGAVTWIPNDIRLNINDLNKYFIKHGVTHTIITTQIAKFFVENIKETSIKNLYAAGEKLGAVNVPCDYTLVDAYGPTEALSTMTSINVADKIEDSSVGSTDWNTKIYVLDSDKRRVPIGAVGELYISGYPVTREYLNNPEASREAFFDNPFDGKMKNYEKMYKTGDIVRVLPDGTVGYIGRKDSQVKIRGNRVELSEIEAVIREIDYVEDVTVQTIKNGSNSEVVAYVVAHDLLDEANLEDSISYYVTECKPEYMVPSFIVSLDEIPLNVNCKVDKRALPKVNIDDLRVDYVAPTSDVERDIVNAFEKVLNQEKIGIYDDFTRLGGDSLSAIKLLSYLDNYNISVFDVLRLHTPWAIAKNLNDLSLNLDIYSLESGCPLNESQLNVYLDILKNNKLDSYLIPFFINLQGKYDVNSIKEALMKMFDVHPILSMRISDENNIPYLVKGSQPSIVFKPEMDSDFVNEFLTKQFDLYEGLSRYLIFKYEDGYVLSCVFHHIIFDALSSQVFKKNLEDILEGRPVEKDDSFLKVSAFSHEIQKTDEYEKAADFFNLMLGDTSETMDLPDSLNADGPCVKELKLDLDNALMNSFLQKNNTNENVLFTSAFAYTLSRFTGSPKALFNMVENGRGRFNNYDSIGMFVNTLPLLADCKDQNVSDFIKYMSNLIYNAMSYDFYPFRTLANEYDIDSSILFQYIPNWIDEENLSESISVENKNKIVQSMNDVISDLIVYVVQNGEEYSLNVTYSEIYSSDFIDHFMESYNLIVSQMTYNAVLGDIDYILESDLKLFDETNDTGHDISYEDILDAFNDNLSKYPKRTLVSYNDVSYSYEQCAYVANQIAQKLIDLGVNLQDSIGFLVERSPQYVFSILAILSIGGVYVPLDDALPDNQLEYMIDDVSCSVVIATDETYGRVQELYDGCILNISEFSRDCGVLNHLDTVLGDLSCILYTSGSTGLPKGVKVTRKSALNVSAYYADAYCLGSDDVFGMFASIGFDAGSHAILTVIYAGATLSIVPKDIRLDIFKLNDYFINQCVTQSFITTQVGKLFAQNIKDTSLKVLVVGGEKLGAFESPEDYDLIDIYGPTEAFVFVSSSNNLSKIDYSSVGNLIYNTKAYILDDEKRRVPMGAIGELYLAGHQISEGYLNNDEMTRDSFINNPFEDDDNYSVMYKTGDMVRYLPDGSLAIVGRRDNQVKIRGNRVELSEIELLIRELGFVEDVTVQIHQHGSNNELVAYVVPSTHIFDLSDTIRRHVLKNKADYMVPSHVITLEEIPLNVNGKVDKRKLPPVEFKDSEDYEMPKSYMEQIISDAFAEILGISHPVGRLDEFSMLGGDSISVMMLIAKLRDYHINVSVKDVLENQSVKNIAEVCDFDLSINKISQDTFEGFVDTTPIVQHFFDSNFKNPSYFNQSMLLESEERIDEDLLKQAMEVIVNHHDLLRSKVKDGKLFVCPKGDDYFTIETCNPLDYKSETQRLQNEIDIVNGPLIKLGIFRGQDNDNLYVVIHHLIVDGVSWRIIIEDLNLAYNQLINDKNIKLPDKTSSYQDYSMSINEYKQSDAALDQKDYWKNTLDKMCGGKHTFMDSNRNMEKFLIKFSKNKALSLIRQAPNSFDTSINALFLSAISKAWKNVMGDDEVSVRLEGHGREHFDENILIDRTVGWFTTCYPVILECIDGDNKEVISKVDKIMDDVPQKGFAYPLLMGIETDELPLITFNYLGEMNKLKTGDIFTAKFRPDLAGDIALENKYGSDLNMNGYSLNNEINFSIEFNKKRFSRESVEKFSQVFLKTLDEIALSCDDYDYSKDIHIFSNHPDKKNLFFIHSANYGSEFFYYLAQQLKDDYSFSVFEPYNIYHKENPLVNIEDFASTYINIIKRIQPEGPYYLGGLCFGGAIALEIAQQLEKMGDKTDKLILVDAHYIGDKQLRDSIMQYHVLFLRERMEESDELAPKDVNLSDMVFHAKLSVNMWLTYEPSHYDGDTIYFRATIKPQDDDIEVSNRVTEYIFSKKAGGYEDFFDEDKFSIVNVPAEHENMFCSESLKIMGPEIKRFIGD